VTDMNAGLRRIFDNVPEDEPRSRLEPYRELILGWRREGRSHRRICELLSDQCGLQIGKTAMHQFVQRRSRPCKGNPESQAEPSVSTEYLPGLPAPEPESEPTLTAAPIGLRRRRSPEELAAQREAIRAAFNKPVVPHEEEEEVFVFDPDKPLINKHYNRHC
jgi:hypothetical protein